MLPVLQLGGLAIPMPPLVLLLSLYVALDISQRQAVRRGLDGEQAYNLAFNSLIAGLLSARLAFILLNLDSYLAIRPIGRMIVSFVTPLLGSELPIVGLVVGLLMAAIYVRRFEFDWKKAIDAYAVGAAVFVVGLWLAHLLSGDAYGTETFLPWGLNLWGARRHPTQIYNLIASAAIFWVLLQIEPAREKGKKRKKKGFSGRPKRLQWRAPYDGFVAQLFVTLTGTTILVLEPLRADSEVLAGGFRTWQIGALVALVLSLALYARFAPTESRRESATS